ncbi:MAG: hypothetical protein ACHQRM_17815, partial [Bacteroidia bacterium]
TIAGDIDITGARLHVDASTGRIGVNTSTPSYPVDIIGSGITSGTASFSVRNQNLNYLIFARDDNKVGINTGSPTSTLHIAGSISANVTSNTASYTLAATDYCVIFTGGSASTYTLPTASTCTGRIYLVVNHGAVALTISAYTIANATTATSISAGSSLQLISDGTVWRKIN